MGSPLGEDEFGSCVVCARGPAAKQLKDVLKEAGILDSSRRTDSSGDEISFPIVSGMGELPSAYRLSVVKII